MPASSQSTAQPTTTSSGASAGSTASAGGASASCRSGLRGMSYAEQVQMLVPAESRRRPVQREEAAVAAPASSSPIELLQEAWAEGTAAFQSAVDSLPTEQLVAALPAVQDGFYWLLDKLWPSGSGWSASLGVSGEGTIAGSDGGIPCDLELSGEGSVKVTLTRSGGEVELAVEVEAEAGGAGEASIKVAKLPIAGTVMGAAGFTLSVDLGAVSWPTGAWSKLTSGDLKGAFGEVFRSGLSLGRNTQLEVELAGGQKLGSGGEIGLEGLLAGKAEIGLKAGLQTTFSNPTDTKEGELVLAGSLGAFGKLQIESIQAGTLQPVIDLVSYLLSADFGAMGDTAAELEAAVGLELAMTYPKLKDASQIPSVALKIFAQLDGALTVLGLGLDEGSAKASMTLGLPDVPGFIDALEARGAAGMASSGQLLPVAGIAAEVEGTLSFGALSRALGSETAALFGTVESNLTGGLADASFALEMEFTRDELVKLQETLFEKAGAVLDALSKGDLLGALRAYVVYLGRGLLEAGAAFINAIKKLEVQLEVGIERKYGAETPLAGTVSGAKGEIEGSIANVYKADLDPGQVSAATAEKVLRAILGI